MAIDRAEERARRLPAVGSALTSEAGRRLVETYGRAAASRALAEAVDGLRAELAAPGRWDAASRQELLLEAVARAEDSLAALIRPSLRPVINATGIVLHTGLGRAPLASRAAARIAAIASRYTNLELDLASGERGSRHDHVEPILCRLLNSEAAMVVNNNAAAVLLALAAVGRGREVIVSRGELVEIGGGFRVPEIMAESGARLVEVGTTNRTRLVDYELAITPETAGLLKVHRSNFRQVGFTESVPVAELSALAERHGLAFVEDLGSGLLVPVEGTDEPVAGESLAMGAQLITMSGDKLLGGPQVGIAAGRRAIVESMKRHPLARALRVDKLTLAALGATLELYLDSERARRGVPVLEALGLQPAELRRRAQALARRLRAHRLAADVRLLEDHSQAGGGSLPGYDFPTWVVAVRPHRIPADELHRRLRLGEPAVLARVRRDELLLDPRTLLPGEARELAECLRQALAEGGERR